MRFLLLSAMILMMGSMTACSESKREDLKSPCVGSEGSPCGPHRPVNNWWLT